MPSCFFHQPKKSSFKFPPPFFQILAGFNQNYAPPTSSRRKYFSRQFLEKVRIVPRFYRLTRIIDDLIRWISRVSLLPAVCAWRINSGIVLIKIPRRVVFFNPKGIVGSICSGCTVFTFSVKFGWFRCTREIWKFWENISFSSFSFFFRYDFNGEVIKWKNKFCCFFIKYF